MFRELTEASVARRGERAGVASAKRHIAVLGPRFADLKPRLLRAQHLAESLDVLAAA